MATALAGSSKTLGQKTTLQLSRAALLVGRDDENATAPSLPPLPPRSGASFRPNITVIAGVVTAVFSVIFLFLLYAKHCRRTAGTGRPYGAGGGGGFFGGGARGSSARRNSGVDRTVVESLPVFRFGALRGRKEGLECAVCLGLFGTEELLRLLPKCKHAFHIECVDTWLDAHSTCPLCRHRVDPEDVLLAFHEFSPLAGPKPHPSDAEGGPSTMAGRHSPAPAPFRFLRAGRVSGRHSSAGEKRSDAALQVVVLQRPGETNPSQRGSVDNALMLRAAAAMASSKASMGCFERGSRKDALLLAGDAMQQQQRFGHRIVVSDERDPERGITGDLQRWSDMRPQDLLLLRREMAVTDGGRASSGSSSAASGRGGEGAGIVPRSFSEITGLSRFSTERGGGTAGGRAAEERVLRRWLALASRRAGRWVGGADGPGGGVGGR